MKDIFFVLKTAKLPWICAHFVPRQEGLVELVCFYSTYKEQVFIIHQNMSPYLVSFCGVLQYKSCTSPDIRVQKHVLHSFVIGLYVFIVLVVSRTKHHTNTDTSGFFSVSQLSEWLGEDLPSKLHPNSAGCAAYTCEDHWHCGNSLHLQRSLLQVSKAVMYLFMMASGLRWAVCAIK